MLFKVAWRNIWRNTRRSMIIIAAVAIGLFAGIFLVAFYNGMLEQRVNTAIQSEISHLQLHHPQFLKDYDIRYYLDSGSSMLQQIETDENVQSAAGRIVIRGMIASATGSSGITINGIMPGMEKEVTLLPQKLIDGQYFDSLKRNQVLVSQRMLKKLKLHLKNKVILTFQDKDGNIASAAFRIVGVYQTANTPYDDGNVFVNLNDIDNLAGIKNQVNEIAVLLKKNQLLDETQARLQQQFPQVEVKNWKEISPEISLTVSSTHQMFYIFMGIILLALAFGIINTMMMAVLDRTREIGMLIALGMNRWKVFRMILLETVFLVLAGSPAGLLLSFLTILITHNTGISLSKYRDVYASFGYADMVYPSLGFQQFWEMMTLVIITAIISSVFPAVKAIRLKPAESIRK